MAQVFISYRREDGREFSRRLREDLRGRGHAAWLDDQIRPGEPWTLEIEVAIDGSHTVVAVLSPNYVRSRIARMEIERADQQRKRIIPLLLARDAPKPLLLTSIQHIDFTDPATYAVQLDALVHAIERAPGPEDAPEARPAGANAWTDLVARTATRTHRFLEAHRGTPQQPGAFVPALYVRRDELERALARFLTAAEPAVVIVGDAGVGKTTALCHWAEQLVAEGHAVLPYDCGALADHDIEREIARDLAWGSADGLQEALTRIEGAPADRALVIIFDSINDYRGDGARSTETLLRRINAFVARLQGRQVRVALSCSSATWKHLERQGPIRLEASCYFRWDDDPVLHLRAFTPDELARAYPLYAEAFDLFSPFEALSPELRDRLRDPVLLRLTAETYRGVQTPLVPGNLALRIYRQFFDERVRHPREAWVVDALAGEMLTRGTSALPITELWRNPQLGPEILSEDQASAFGRLLDRGVLQDWQGDPGRGTMIRFAHSRVAAYALALHLRQRQPSETDAVRALLARIDAFPLAWEVALALILLSKSVAAVTALAESRDVEQRELACETLVLWHAEAPQEATDLLRALLDGPLETARRTALRAAYAIGPQARDIFLRAALEGEPVLREAVKSTLYLVWRNESSAARRKAADTLYVIWRHAPGFTYDVLDELLAQIGFRNVGRLREILEFVIDLSVTIYINHCDNPEVVEKTADLYHDLATERLHLNLLNTGILGPAFEALVFRAVARAFSGRILDWMLFADVVPVNGFFDLPAGERERLLPIAAALEAGTTLEPIEADLAVMLQSPVPTFASAAALALAVHACRDLPRSEPVIRRLFDAVDARGRLWVLAAFSVLIQDTPAKWIPLLEELTRRYLADHREAFLSPATTVLRGLDLVLLPLGLAYGKQGAPMSLFRTLLDEALAASDHDLAGRVVRGLGPVGFYYPEPTLDLLAPVAARLHEGWAHDALLAALATMNTIHFDAVDLFLHRLHADEVFARRIDAAADEELVRRYIHVVGYYNNAVHYTIHYPRMRRQLSMGALKLLATARDPQQFVADYTVTAIRMFRDANFQLREWTRPD